MGRSSGFVRRSSAWAPFIPTPSDGRRRCRSGDEGDVGGVPAAHGDDVRSGRPRRPDRPRGQNLVAHELVREAQRHKDAVRCDDHGVLRRRRGPGRGPATVRPPRKPNCAPGDRRGETSAVMASRYLGADQRVYTQHVARRSPALAAPAGALPPHSPRPAAAAATARAGGPVVCARPRGLPARTPRRCRRVPATPRLPPPPARGPRPARSRQQASAPWWQPGRLRPPARCCVAWSARRRSRPEWSRLGSGSTRTARLRLEPGVPSRLLPAPSGFRCHEGRRSRVRLPVARDRCCTPGMIIPYSGRRRKPRPRVDLSRPPRAPWHRAFAPPAGDTPAAPPAALPPRIGVPRLSPPGPTARSRLAAVP